MSRQQTSDKARHTTRIEHLLPLPHFLLPAANSPNSPSDSNAAYLLLPIFILAYSRPQLQLARTCERRPLVFQSNRSRRPASAITKCWAADVSTQTPNPITVAESTRLHLHHLLYIFLDSRYPDSQFPIQLLLFLLGRRHTHSIFHLRRGPEPNRRPGHHADSE